jgi:hypothetical protein
MVLVLLLNYLGILSKAIGGHRNYGGFMGKADRMFVLSVACVGAYGLQSVAVFNWMFWVIAMGALLSIGIRLRQIRQQNYS